MPALPTGLISQIANVQPLPKLKQAYLIAIDLAPGENPPWAEGGKSEKVAFQYWPESLTDSRPVEWNPRNIPGGSHPIYQWSHGGERRLSFTAVFARDTQPPEENTAGGGGLLGDVVGAVGSALDAVGLGQPKGDPSREAPIESAVSWLRYFTYPLYIDKDSRVFEPPKCILVMPNSKIGYDGSSEVTCVMTSCEVTYEAWFPNGMPRIVEINLEFAEVVQSNKRIRFHSRSDMQPSKGVKTLVIHEDSGGEKSVLENIAGAVTGTFGL